MRALLGLPLSQFEPALHTHIRLCDSYWAGFLRGASKIGMNRRPSSSRLCVAHPQAPSFYGARDAHTNFVSINDMRKF